MAKKDMCIACGKEPITVKKRMLGPSCYQRIRKEGFPDLENPRSQITRMKREQTAHVNFINYHFKHDEWCYRLITFRLRSGLYTPPFYDKDRNIYIDVATTRQNYNAKKQKHVDFRKTFPKCVLEVYYPDGRLMDEENPTWAKPN